MTAGGLFIGQGVPLLAGFGIEEIGRCIWPFFEDSEKEREEIDYANGAFLPFEHKGEKFKKQAFYQLTKDNFNYNAIFDHSFEDKQSDKKGLSKLLSPYFKTNRILSFLINSFLFGASFKRSFQPCWQ